MTDVGTRPTKPSHYRIQFVRIGRNHFVPDLDVVANDADEIAEQVHQVARKYVASRFFGVIVDLENGKGYIEGGRFGRFVITPAPTTPDLGDVASGRTPLPPTGDVA